MIKPGGEVPAQVLNSEAAIVPAQSSPMSSARARPAIGERVRQAVT
jgi:hypothetical protein